MLTLQEAMGFPALSAAQPVLRCAAPGGLGREVRWVHSSEVLEIAPLLRGGEVLLTGGAQLSSLAAPERRAYVRSLAARGVAALAVETARWEPADVEVLAAEAEAAGLTLVELRRTVRFVDIAEELNSAIVNRQARVRSVVDDLSHRIAEHISVHGPDLPEVLRLAAESLRARVSLIGPGGEVQHAAGEPGPGGEPEEDLGGGVEGGTDGDRVVQEAGVIVAGHVAARLRIASAVTAEDVLAAAASRLAEVLALALVQSFRPSADQVAEVRLMRAVLDGAPRDAVERLWAGTAVPRGPACVVVGWTLGPTSAHETVLRRAIPVGAGTQWGRGRAVLVPLGEGEPPRRRAAVVSALRAAVDGLPVRCAVGPLVWDGIDAHESFLEARALLEEGGDDPGVVDVSARFAARVAARLEAEDFVPVQVRAALGRVQDWDRRHGTALVETLGRWLDTGCHATGAAARLHVERQTLHKRLAKCFELLGEDPREGGDVFPLHVAVRVALLRTDT
ncbi:PucR family transcriptional regulator [Citricoccus sp. SGAir0253]|uniref:PucR family transcriptional regulator n=1 Tax=Citricoccus sp. SGAir0253 TaxID=2567881 RepID=UPI0010CCE248|nr:PucR family transcriptional regulator [Citricoccus sp. SGAir0253]QCU78910.1 PucR family transcriptional regulator [Citricoccus sp. SGAir0253]